MLHTLTFLGLAGLCVLFSLATLVLKNMFHTFLAFLGALLSVAGVYFSLQVDYVGAAQVIVYAGSVAVLIVLALLLINHKSGDLSNTNLWSHKWLGSTLAALMVGGVLSLVILYTDYTGLPFSGETSEIVPVPYTAIAGNLLTKYPVAFEAMAVLLLVALVAALLTAQVRSEKMPEVKKCEPKTCEQIGNAE